MRINWFPGHMNKARREIREAMRRTDVVVEVLDARLPRSSRNPMLERLAGSVPVVRVLAKSDLADPLITQRWLEAFEGRGQPALALVASRKTDAARLLAECRRVASPRRRVHRPTYAMVVGIPNVGKSTLLNALAGRKVAQVEDRPAVTQRQQQTEAADDVLVIDTPGVLWPRLDDQEGANRLAMSGAIKEAVVELESIARYGLGLLTLYYPAALEARYEIDLAAARRSHETLDESRSGVGVGVGVRRTSPTPAEAPDSEQDEDAAELDLLGAFDVVGAFERTHRVDTFSLLEQLGRKRGCLVRGNEVDREKAARLFLRDLRSGKLGPVTLDRPGEQMLKLPKPPLTMHKARLAKLAERSADGSADPRELPAKRDKHGKRLPRPGGPKAGSAESRGSRAKPAKQSAAKKSAKQSAAKKSAAKKSGTSGPKLSLKQRLKAGARKTPSKAVSKRAASAGRQPAAAASAAPRGRAHRGRSD